MIPIFPQFKKLELPDRKDVESFTSGNPPYSDFNFASMWLWDHKGDTIISNLNGNLVARLSDSRTGESFYSFIGADKCNETVSELLEYLGHHGLIAELMFVPEVSANELNGGKFLVVEDRDNFDYVFCAKQLSGVAGSKYSGMRTKIRHFERNDYQFLRLDLADKSSQAKLLNCVESWTHLKSNHRTIEESWVIRCLEAEQIAFKRLFYFPELLDPLTCFGLFVDGVLSGFSIGEIIQDYFLLHFHKSNYRHRGTNEFLFQQMARNLCESGINYLNNQEDLGLQGLRRAKSSYRPVHFLKKYIVRSAK